MSGLRFLPAAVDVSDLTADIADAKAIAEAADQRAGRAMQRANAADETGTAAHQIAVEADAKTLTLAQAQAQLEALAQTLGAAIPASEATHAAINKRIDDIQLTPGPAGKDGAKGAVGAAGADGGKGATGDAGTANLAVGLKPITLLALGGNTTITIPWGRTLTVAPTNVQFAHSAVLSLANVTYTNVVVTTTGVTVKVTSVGLALAAGTLLALGW